MKKILRIVFLSLCVTLVCGLKASALSKTYYAKAIATVGNSGLGKVYASTTSDTPSESAYQPIESSATGSGSSSGSNASVKFYLHAQAEDGYMLEYWADENGTNKGSSNPLEVTITSSNTNSSSPATATYTAYFCEKAAVSVISNMPGVGTVTIDNAKNKVGDKIKVTTTMKNFSGSYQVINHSAKFLGWYDQDGNCVSTSTSYTFTIEKPMDLTARYDFPKIENGGYYRILSFTGRAMTVIGNFSFSLSNYTQMKNALCYTTPSDYKYSFEGGPAHNVLYWSCMEKKEVEAMPGTIIRLTGNLDKENNILTNGIASSQGTDTYAMAKQYFTIQTHQDSPAYYWISNSGKAMKFKTDNQKTVEYEGTTVQNAPEGYIELGNHATGSAYAYELWALVPIDEAHVDENWFGAHPDEEMKEIDDDGNEWYWASMYTAFPYKCYEEDGVEAYYISSTNAPYKHNDGSVWLQLAQIEDGIVPANTAVLLRCKDAASAKGNRLIPINDINSPIPALNNNLLHGEYQLHTSATATEGDAKFNSATMRIFSINSAGVIGFYKLAENTTLTANRVWLDISDFSEDLKKAPMRIISSDFSGIEEVSDDTRSEEMEAVIYDLNGHRVRKCEPGKIYIINGKKVLKLR